MMRLDSNKIWAAVNVKPNQANKVEANLMRQGLNFFTPRIKITKRQQNRFIHRFDLLFPGYMFVQIDTANEDARKLHSTYGVSSIVRVGNCIGALPDDFIEAMRNNTHEIHNKACIDLTPRQKVEITRGPFAGIVGELIRLDTSQRVKCLFELMSGKVSISLDKDHLVVIG